MSIARVRHHALFGSFSQIFVDFFVNSINKSCAVKNILKSFLYFENCLQRLISAPPARLLCANKVRLLGFAVVQSLGQHIHRLSLLDTFPKVLGGSVNLFDRFLGMKK